MRKLSLVLLCVVTLAACAPMRFRPGDGVTKSEQDAHADTTACEASNPYSGVIPARNYHERCMMGKGWVREK